MPQLLERIQRVARRTSRSRHQVVAWLAVFTALLALSCGDDQMNFTEFEPDGDWTPTYTASDLAVTRGEVDRVVLTWTAPFEDSLEASVYYHEIRYTKDSLTAWEDRPQVYQSPKIVAVDTTSYVALGLAPDTRYYFQMQASDIEGATLKISNLASGSTVAPEVVDGMVWIAPGPMRLGNGSMNYVPPQHLFTDGFWIDVCEVTNGKYAEFMEAGGYETEEWWHPAGWAWRMEQEITSPWKWDSDDFHGGGIAGNDDFPVNGVSWWEADAYCRWAGKRLPTESEWEKAARGGCEMWGDPGRCEDSEYGRFPWSWYFRDERANLDDTDDPYENGGWTTPVGFYDGRLHEGYQTINSPSAYGLYDVIGNLWEWTSSRFDAYPYDPEDGREAPPTVADEIPGRVRRGGSWVDSVNRISCSTREGRSPDTRLATGGFRGVRD